MFMEAFLSERRQEFADSIKSFMYEYDASGKSDTARAYRQGSANINGDVITYTLVLPAVLDVSHTVTKVYLYETDEPVAGEEIGEVDGINMSVNASQTIMIKISVTYLETSSPSNASTGDDAEDKNDAEGKT